jgi:exonuclease III
MDLRQCDESRKNTELNHSLSILHQNIRSIRNKSEELTNSLKRDEIDPHVLCFSEHHMVEQDLLLYKLFGYTLGSSYSRQTFQKGGVCIFVREDLCCNRTDVSYYCEEKNFETYAVLLEIKGFHIIIICIYRSPPGDFGHFLRLLDATLKYLQKPKTEFVICGNINVDYITDNHRKQQLSLLLNTYNLVHTVDFPMRVIRNLGTEIDNIFVDNYRVNSFKISSIVNGLSDHDAQYLILENVSIESNITPVKYRTRLINKDTIKTFPHLLKYETWESVYLNNDVNSMFNTF